MMNIFRLLTFLVSLVATFKVLAIEIPSSPRAERAIASVESSLKKQLRDKKLSYGSPIFIRIFKDPGVLEVWVESPDGAFEHFKNYKICSFSGNLGPKLKVGDLQSPEGFYFVNAGRLNPWSQFHLSFNLGYPNQYDRYYGRTGSALMVHGNCVSIGCYAMTDPYINEIYALTVAALESGQPFVRVHVFPFALEQENLSKYTDNQWHDFWLNLKEGYDYFNQRKRPPNVEVEQGKYVFD
ncbi:MAG: murein L,D-transpeptidase [Pseudomonadales bacterium]|nr:murein L,D-transpeptidase [Pseudomonadales bacterium]